MTIENELKIIELLTETKDELKIMNDRDKRSYESSINRTKDADALMKNVMNMFGNLGGVKNGK